MYPRIVAQLSTHTDLWFVVADLCVCLRFAATRAVTQDRPYRSYIYRRRALKMLTRTREHRVRIKFSR